MKQTELRELIRNSIEKPLRICMDDGRTFKITHPDFALATPDAVGLSSAPGHEFGTSFVICWFEHVSRVEVQERTRSKSKT